MAKKKKKAPAPAGFAAISPEKYIRTVARTLPLGACYVNPDWQEAGLAHIFVTRRRPSGNVVMGCFLVDTFCLGVKDAFVGHNISPGELDRYLAEASHLNLEEIPYPEAHNIIYGAIEFAEEAGIEPHPGFGLAEYVLEEDTDDIPLIEYDFGREGRHHLICRPGGEEKKLIPQLRERLGADFDFEYASFDYDDDDDFYEDDDDDDDFPGGEYEERYSYRYPEYPASAEVKHQFIADTLLASRYPDPLPEGFADRVFALPPDEAAADLAAVILYEIGRSYPLINDDDYDPDKENAAIIHAVSLLACIDSREALPALLEIARMNDAFYDLQLGDMGAEHLPQAIWCAAGGDIAPLENFLYEPGLNVWMRLKVAEAITYTALFTPDTIPAVIETWRRILRRLVDDHNAGRGEELDPSFAGCLVGELLDIDCTPLLPEIEALYATYRVDYSVVGDLAEVRRIIAAGDFHPAQTILTYPEILARIFP